VKDQRSEQAQDRQGAWITVPPMLLAIAAKVIE
jgi:hypothetical protein